MAKCFKNIFNGFLVLVNYYLNSFISYVLSLMIFIRTDFFESKFYPVLFICTHCAIIAVLTNNEENSVPRLALLTTDTLSVDSTQNHNEVKFYSVSE